MAASLKGSPELRRRLRAIRTVFKPAGRNWAEITAQVAKPLIPVRTGKTRASVRKRNASQKRATVVGRFPVNFIDAGTKEHDVMPKKAKALKWRSGGTTYFRPKARKPRQAARPFKERAAREGLRRVDLIGDLVDLWNRAA